MLVKISSKYDALFSLKFYPRIKCGPGNKFQLKEEKNPTNPIIEITTGEYMQFTANLFILSTF